MHIRKFLSIFLIGLVFAIAGCSSGGSSSGIGDQELAPDTDGDGIINDNDLDIDGDGIPNKDDPDIDGDGTPNGEDGNPNGGPGVTPPTPGLACSSAKIIVPSDEIQTGSTGVRVQWDLLPADCGLTPERNTSIRVYATNPTASDSPNDTGAVLVGKGSATLTIPNNCDWTEAKQSITYDFSEIGTALGDPSAGTPKYSQSVSHPVGQGTCNAPDKPGVVDLTRISHHKDATCTVESSGAVSCTGATNPIGGPAQYYYVWTKVTEALPIGYYQSPPTWTATGDLFMNIYLSKGSEKKTLVYEGGSSEWTSLLAANAGWKVRTNYVDAAGVGWENRPNPGNFILKIGTAATTISKYNIPTPASNAVDPVIADSNIGRLNSASCTQNDPTSSAVTCTADTAGEFWLWATNQRKVRPLSHFRKPTWSVSPDSGGAVHIYLTKTDECEASFPGGKADGSSPASWLFIYRGLQDSEKWDGLADQCKVRITLEETPGSDYQSMPRPGNFILKAGSHKSITITKFSAGELN